MIPKRNYYLNDYFDLFDNNYSKEKEYMKTDIFEHNNKYIIETDLPGLNKENIKITYENGYLAIKATKKQLSSNPNTYIRRERFFGEIKRTFFIGMKKESDIKAAYQNGILQISFPKEDISHTETKNITIS